MVSAPSSAQEKRLMEVCKVFLLLVLTRTPPFPLFNYASPAGYRCFQQDASPQLAGERRMQKEETRLGATPLAKGILPLKHAYGQTCAPGYLRLGFLLHECLVCRRGPRVAWRQQSSLRRLGSHGLLQIVVRTCSRLLPGSTSTVCCIHTSHACVCCVSGFAGSPRAAGSPGCSRSQGEPNLRHAAGVS